ncbi:hypothetical protein KQX54_020919 [Cotesia glomerata]|uniref:Uncharacterized protein n=1 Tax=Cotesia glomerata TaxID=32391 RepID=A0AAV7I5I3_COTGL|nr:hypothetical protein KQX54_020919 [Cotesia glomerata]
MFKRHNDERARQTRHLLSSRAYSVLGSVSHEPTCNLPKGLSWPLPSADSSAQVIRPNSITFINQSMRFAYSQLFSIKQYALCLSQAQSQSRYISPMQIPTNYRESWNVLTNGNRRELVADREENKGKDWLK